MKLTLVLSCLSVFFSGCSTPALPMNEYGNFFARKQEFRAIKEPSIEVKYVNEPHVECTRRVNHSSALGCAYWNNEKCWIIIGQKTSYTIIGHEIRHCFEGNFHGIQASR